jgi:arylsulfatase A-like enzyme
VFCADHGEMLGDHQWIRKRNAFEPAARIPFLARFPGEMNLVQGCVRDDVVELMDIMPTLLEAAGVNIPSTVEGRSLLPLLRGNGAWRAYVHGECANIPTRESGMEYLTDGRRKYIWYPAQGMEQYFDLEKDPREMTDLAGASGFGDEIGYWRGLLMRELRGRPEGFTDGRELKHLPGPTASCLPGFESR